MPAGARNLGETIMPGEGMAIAGDITAVEHPTPLQYARRIGRCATSFLVHSAIGVGATIGGTELAGRNLVTHAEDYWNAHDLVSGAPILTAGVAVLASLAYVIAKAKPKIFSARAAICLVFGVAFGGLGGTSLADEQDRTARSFYVDAEADACAKPTPGHDLAVVRLGNRQRTVRCPQ